MPTSRRTATLAVALLALALSLTGCLGAAPVATPLPVATAVPTIEPEPTAEPVDPLTTVVELVARPAGLELRADGDIVVTTLDYMSDPADAIATLTTVFGTPPVDEPYPGGNHNPPGVIHHWDMFVLDERHYDEVRRIDDGYDWLVWPRFAVYFDGPAAGGLTLSSSSGLQAGDTWAEAEADEGFDPELWTCTGTSIEAVEVPVASEGREHERVNVIVMPSDDGSHVKWIGAPEMEASGCA